GVQRVQRRHRLLEDDGDAVTAHPLHHGLGSAHELLARKADASARMPRRRIGQELHDRQRRDRFAGAALAHQRHRLPALDVEGDVPDRLDLAPLHGERDGEVAHGEQRRHRTFRGSKASRTASPMKMRSESMTARTTKPVRPSQGAWRFALPWARISPREAEPGGRPKPRKSSDVSVVMAPLRMKGRKVRVATIALGNRWRAMMTVLRTPRARAART